MSMNSGSVVAATTLMDSLKNYNIFLSEIDFVVGHMLASNYFQHDRQAFSTANCTTENSKSNIYKLVLP